MLRFIDFSSRKNVSKNKDNIQLQNIKVINFLQNNDRLLVPKMTINIMDILQLCGQNVVVLSFQAKC